MKKNRGLADYCKKLARIIETIDEFIVKEKIKSSNISEAIKLFKTAQKVMGL